jgi:hypothetical protein
MSVADEAVKRKLAGLDLTDREDRVVAFFFRKRASKVVVPAMGVDELVGLLDAESAAARAYIATKAPLIAGNDSKTPAHLDLDAVANLTASAGPAETVAAGVRESRYRRNRKRWIAEIVWRALAIHEDLWKQVSPPAVNVVALDEVLDRRLRVVEHMTCNVNTDGSFIDGTLQRWKVAGLSGPWKDNARVRVVEYPVIPHNNEFARIKTELLAHNWLEVGDTFRYREPSGVETHFRPDLAPSWRTRPGGGGAAWVLYVPKVGVGPAGVLRRMFEPREDFLERSWLYCDMCGSMTNLEALAFALARRTGSDAEFDAVANKVTNPDPARYDAYMALGPVVYADGPRDMGSLMADPHDPYFENTTVALDELQVGDFTVFWSNRVYDAIAAGAWVNEFSHVMGVDADPATGKVQVDTDGPQIWFAGHGIHTQSYAGMAAHLARALADAMKLAIDLAKTTHLARFHYVNTDIVQWSPYEDFTAPGAYWIEIRESTWKGRWLFKSLDDVLAAVPRTIADSLGGGTGYHPPPDTTAAYFPLFEPALFSMENDPWRTYLSVRKADPAFRAPPKLDVVHVDGSIVMAVHYRGGSGKIPVVRPRVRP